MLRDPSFPIGSDFFSFNFYSFLSHVIFSYWLHLLELAYFLHHLVASLELSQSLDKSFLKTCEEKALQSPDEKGFPEAFREPVYSKEVISQFHLILCLLENSPDADWIYHLTSADEEMRKQLKMNLLSLLTASAFIAGNDFFSNKQKTSAPPPPSALFKSTISSSEASIFSNEPHHWRYRNSSFQLNTEKGESKDLEEGVVMSYSANDILNGSAFMAFDLDE